MKKSLSSRFTNWVILFIILHTVLFIILHFITPDIGQVHITISPSEDNPEVCYVTVNIDNPFDEYYVLVYEDQKTNHWVYSSSNSYGVSTSDVLDEFLPTDKSKYILLSGTTHKDSFTFTLKSRYPISYMSSIEHIFHVHYVVPLYIFPSNFYFNKHYIFFVDPLT